MRKMKLDLDMLDAYLQGHLTREAKQKFISKIKNNPYLRKQVWLFCMAIKLLREEHK